MVNTEACVRHDILEQRLNLCAFKMIFKKNYSCLWILPQTHVFHLSKRHNQLLVLMPIHTALVADWIQCVTSQTSQDPTNADLTCSDGENKCQQMPRGVTLIKQTQDECVCFRLLASVGEVWIGFKGTGIMMVIVSVWKTTPESHKCFRSLLAFLTPVYSQTA